MIFQADEAEVETILKEMEDVEEIAFRSSLEDAREESNREERKYNLYYERPAGEKKRRTYGLWEDCPFVWASAMSLAPVDMRYGATNCMHVRLLCNTKLRIR